MKGWFAILGGHLQLWQQQGFLSRADGEKNETVKEKVSLSPLSLPLTFLNLYSFGTKFFGGVEGTFKAAYAIGVPWQWERQQELYQTKKNVAGEERKKESEWWEKNKFTVFQCYFFLVIRFVLTIVTCYYLTQLTSKQSSLQSRSLNERV